MAPLLMGDITPSTAYKIGRTARFSGITYDVRRRHVVNVLNDRVEFALGMGRVGAALGGMKKAIGSRIPTRLKAAGRLARIKVKGAVGRIANSRVGQAIGSGVKRIGGAIKSGAGRAKAALGAGVGMARSAVGAARKRVGFSRTVGLLPSAEFGLRSAIAGGYKKGSKGAEKTAMKRGLKVAGQTGKLLTAALGAPAAAAYKGTKLLGGLKGAAKAGKSEMKKMSQ